MSLLLVLKVNDDYKCIDKTSNVDNVSIRLIHNTSQALSTFGTTTSIGVLIYLFMELPLLP